VIPTVAAVVLLLAAAPQAQAPAPRTDAQIQAKVGGTHAPADTKCSACHTPEGWGDVKFVHERTGFPLTGLHAQVACRKCHVVDFKEPLARSCSACHRDVHGGYSGVQCASCHDTDGWKSRFDADAHRRTNFPLQGRHALLPCEQCHGDRRDRAFARPTVACWECHQADLASASAKGVDHSAFPGYPQLACLGCHGFWRWSPASFTGHGACFPIDSGKHAGIPCMQCHVTLPVPLAIGSCTSQPYPACIRCHSCATHPPVQSFVCADQNCYGCHFNGTAEGGSNLRGKSLRTSPQQRQVKP
jgi:mono/diheme cytochrome c family protein